MLYQGYGIEIAATVQELKPVPISLLDQNYLMCKVSSPYTKKSWTRVFEIEKNSVWSLNCIICSSVNKELWNKYEE